MVNEGRPTVGVALNAERLKEYRDWVLDSQRDLEIQDSANPFVLGNGWKDVAKEVNQLLDGHTGRLGIHAPFVDLTIGAVDPLIRSSVVERLTQGLEFGAAIDATHMVIHSPVRFLGANPFEPSKPILGSGSEVDAVKATLDAILPRAEQLGCMLVVENIFDRNPTRLRDVVTSFDSDFVRMSIDIGHAYVMSKLGGASPEQWVREAGPLLAHLHLQDSDGDEDRHWTPGVGTMQWHALFEALNEQGGDPRLIIETRDCPIQGANFLSERGYVN
ncbi:MAG: sugar phosphate isomerase/epimerase [Sphaerobacteraceae bacterium]|nr:MAG: sugar phosphate isomerase/epimerase [Sphaerobacteraceae bacterium]